MIIKKTKTLEKKLDAIVIQIIRHRDGMKCQWCGKQVEMHNAHTSHVIPRTNKNLRWDLLNLKLLCYYCHIQKWHHNPIEAMLWFKSKFPDRYEYIMLKKNEIYKKNIINLQLKYEELSSILKTYEHSDLW